MTLTGEEYNDFLKIHLDLLLFAGTKLKLIASNTKIEIFRKMDLQIKFKCREGLLDNEDILDEYIASNFDHLTDEQLKIVNGFKKKIEGDFVILKCLTNNAIFIDVEDNKFYAVKALSDPFHYFFDKFPVSINTTLLPFKDKIIYDGFLQFSGLYFGKGITESLNEEYKIAKKQKIVSTSLK